MRKTFAALVAILPLAAFAGPPPGTAPGEALREDDEADLPMLALADAPPPPDASASPAEASARFERMERRMRLVRAMGIAEVLDLSEADAERVREQLARFDDQRKPLLRQVHDSMLTLRHAAEGDKAALGQVDDAVKKIFDAREKIQAVDRETFQGLAKGLSAEKRARLAVFLAHFQGRFGMGVGGMGWGGHGMGGPGMGPGRGMGWGPGPGMGGGFGPGRGMGPGPNCPEDCPWRQ